MLDFAGELERQRAAAGDSGNTTSGANCLQEYKLAEGIYFSENRGGGAAGVRGANQTCIEIIEGGKHMYTPPQNPQLLEADLKEFQKRIDKMIESIAEIVCLEDWIQDRDFREAVQENYEVIDRTYKYQLEILKVLSNLDPCCDKERKDSMKEIQQKIAENKLKEKHFLLQLLGKTEEMQQQAISTNEQQPSKEEEEEYEDDGLMSMQEAIAKQTINVDNDDGIYL